MTFSLERKGTLHHYLNNFQKELLRTIDKSTTVTLLENYPLETDGACEGKAREFGNEGTPDPVLNQMVFALRFHMQESTLTCGLHGFSFSNWSFPHITTGRTWGEIIFPLVNIPNNDPLPKTIANRLITIGITTGILRQTTKEGKCCFVKADWEENKPCWVKNAIFDANME